MSAKILDSDRELREQLRLFMKSLSPKELQALKEELNGNTNEQADRDLLARPLVSSRVH